MHGLYRGPQARRISRERDLSSAWPAEEHAADRLHAREAAAHARADDELDHAHASPMIESWPFAIRAAR